MRKVKKIAKVFAVVYISLAVINFMFIFLGIDLMSSILLDPIVLVLGIVSTAILFWSWENKIKHAG